MLIGEAEILGQVKDAYVASAAREIARQDPPPALPRRARRRQDGPRADADRSRSRVRSRPPPSKRRSARFGSLDGKTIVVIGAGKMGRTAVKRLRLEGASRVIVTNRTVARARELAIDAGFGEAVELPRSRRRRLPTPTSSSPRPARRTSFSIRARVAAAMARRPDRPMFVVDIAVPRDADPAIAEIPNVALVDIDGLKSVVNEKLEVRRDAIPEVEEIVEECVARFGQWYRSRVAVPVIAHPDAKSRSRPGGRAGTAVRPLSRLDRARAAARYRA